MMEWWGYLITGCVIWIFGFLTGRAVGQAMILRQMLLANVSKMSSIPGLSPLGGDPRGS